MYLVELFIPTSRGDGSPVKHAEVQTLVTRLADRFGGATAFSRAPAEGLWKERDAISHDQIVIIEVMVEELENKWWGKLRGELERDLQQERVLIRASATTVL